MTRFVATVDIAAAPADVWRLLTDWPAHGRWIPLTRVRVLTPLAAGVGARFVGRTSLAAVGLERLGFDDTMEVTQWHPPSDGLPGRCAIRKLGRVVRGSASFDVSSVSPTPQASDGTARTGARVVWEEDIDIAPRPLFRLLAPLVSWVGGLAFTATLRSMGRELTDPGHQAPMARPDSGS